jgi:prepilin-type N-terminal cleavage/methylation domain-containing protein
MRRISRSVHIRCLSNDQRPAVAGFTLLEMVVVLLLLAVLAGVAIPSMLSSPAATESELQVLIGSARRSAIRRGETVRLQVGRSGTWQVVAGRAARDAPLMTGRLPGPLPATLDLVISPLGTCTPGLDGAAEWPRDLDPWTCELSPTLPSSLAGGGRDARR